MQMDGGTGPLAYGYVRMEEPDQTRIARFRRDLGMFCELGGFRLGSVFVDRGVSDAQFARTGFADLVDAVVVPTLDHLSSHATIRDGLKATVEQLGVQLLVAYDDAGTIRGMGATG